MLEKIVFDQSRWPLVVIYYPKIISNKEWEKNIAFIKEKAENRQPYGFIAVIEGKGDITPIQRKQITDLVTANPELYAEVVIANANVIKSPIAKVIINLMLLFWDKKEAVFPVKIFNDYIQAEEWVIKKIKDRGMYIPPI